MRRLLLSSTIALTTLAAPNAMLTTASAQAPAKLQGAVLSDILTIDPSLGYTVGPTTKLAASSNQQDFQASFSNPKAPLTLGHAYLSRPSCKAQFEKDQVTYLRLSRTDRQDKSPKEAEAKSFRFDLFNANGKPASILITFDLRFQHLAALHTPDFQFNSFYCQAYSLPSPRGLPLVGPPPFDSPEFVGAQPNSHDITIKNNKTKLPNPIVGHWMTITIPYTIPQGATLVGLQQTFFGAAGIVDIANIKISAKK